MALAAQRIDGLRGEFLGDGPERAALRAAIAEHGLTGVVSAPGFADAATLDAEMRRALCLLLPSRREGYGLVVVEASARGTPSVVVAGEDNAATELIEEGVNGTVAPSADAAGARRGDRARARSRAGAAREHRRVVRRATPSACRWSTRCASCSRATAAVGRARAVAVDRRARGALPGELARALAPGRAQPLGERGVVEQPLQRGGDRRARRADRTAAPRRRRPPAARRRSSRRPARRAPSPRAPAARSPRTARGTRTPRRSPTAPRRRRRTASRGSARRSSRPSAARALAQLRFVLGRVARRARARARAAAGMRASAPISASRFLCGRLADRLSTTRRSPRRRRSRSVGSAACGSLRRTAPRPSGTTSMRSAGSAEQLDEVVARALRVGDHAMRAARGRAARARACALSRSPACASGKRA